MHGTSLLSAASPSLPLAGALAARLLLAGAPPTRLPRAGSRLAAARWSAFVAVAALVWRRFDPTCAGLPVRRAASPGSRARASSYHLGVDGISLLLVLLTTFLIPVVILASLDRDRRRASRSFYVALLLLETGMIGVFLALDLFLFYVFWEVMLIPMYFLIGVWGGERRIYAAIKFFLFTWSARC